MANVTIIPTIHMNGTSRQELLDQLLNAMTAIEHAIVALAKASPHGRDYYPQGDDVIVEAQKQHGNRIQVLRIVRDEIEHIAMKIAD